MAGSYSEIGIGATIPCAGLCRVTLASRCARVVVAAQNLRGVRQSLGIVWFEFTGC